MNDRALKVLEQYELEVVSMRRGRGSYILETSQGLRIFSDYSGSENKALFQNCVMEKIREGGYANVDLILPNKEGALISRDWEENKYVVKEWYVGRECDTGSESEILAAVANLARLHQLMVLEEDNGFRENFTARSTAREVEAANGELRRIRRFVRRKNDKCEFERLFLSCFEQYYEQASEAQRQLGYNFRADLKGWAGQGSFGSRVCHGDYNHHHVLICGYEMATTNFDNCRFDVQISDLYRFMRKILEKHDWNVRLGMKMLERYTQERPLDREERSILYVKMLYPEKFHKLANYYYGSNKAWVSNRFLEKLERLNAQEEKRKRFVRMLEK